MLRARRKTGILANDHFLKTCGGLNFIAGRAANGGKVMDRENWRFVAELIGIAAVVASLLALVLELRQTKAAVMTASYQARALDAVALNLALQESELLLPILTRTEVLDPDQLSQLSDLERMRLVLFFNGRNVDADHEYYLYQQGFLDDEHFEYGVKPFVRRNAPRWRALGIDEDRPSFRAFVDSVLAESGDR